MGADQNNGSDRAELKLVWSVPDGDYNCDVEIEAREDGLWIDSFIFIPWDWLIRAMRLCLDEKPHQSPADSKCSPKSSSSQ
jgi:hypothetical protein